jgi:hypothetical protein
MLAHDVAMRATRKVSSEWRMTTGARGQQMVAQTWSDFFEVAFLLLRHQALDVECR